MTLVQGVGGNISINLLLFKFFVCAERGWLHRKKTIPIFSFFLFFVEGGVGGIFDFSLLNHLRAEFNLFKLMLSYAIFHLVFAVLFRNERVGYKTLLIKKR